MGIESAWHWPNYSKSVRIRESVLFSRIAEVLYSSAGLDSGPIACPFSRRRPSLSHISTRSIYGISSHQICFYGGWTLPSGSPIFNQHARWRIRGKEAFYWLCLKHTESPSPSPWTPRRPARCVGRARACGPASPLNRRRPSCGRRKRGRHQRPLEKWNKRLPLPTFRTIDKKKNQDLFPRSLGSADGKPRLFRRGHSAIEKTKHKYPCFLKECVKNLYLNSDGSLNVSSSGIIILSGGQRSKRRSANLTVGPRTQKRGS